MARQIPGSNYKPLNYYCLPRDRPRLMPLITGGYIQIVGPDWTPELLEDTNWWVVF